jgi:CheY-like chemotaxis protein/Tfp pilus assembly protein PilZ
LKKILIDREISKLLLEKNSYLNRADMQLFIAASHDEALEIHRAEHVDVIITDLDAAGMSSEQFCSLIRKDPELLRVSIILVCACDTAQMERSSRAGADAIILKPIKSSFLLAKVKQLLALSWRETYRVILDVSVDGTVSNGTFSCHSLDISTQGLLMETTRMFTIGESVVCSFTLPDDRLIRAKGTVVRNLPTEPGNHANCYGIHFHDLPPDESKAIEDFLDSPARKKRPAIY